MDVGDDSGNRYADPHVLRIVQEAVARGPVLLVTRDRELMVRATVMAPGARMLSAQEWYARTGVETSEEGVS